MTPAVNATHDPALRSWVDSANAADCDFPIQNLPFAIFRRAGSAEPLRAGVAIGDQILDLAALHARSPFSGNAALALAACAEPALNDFMAMGAVAASTLRAELSRVLRAGAPQAALLRADLVAQSQAEVGLPAHIGDYTDFYASIHHATAAGRLMRPDSPLPANYKWMPIAYHGRASSIGVSPQGVRRPLGLSLAAGADAPRFGPSGRLDFELEVGIFIGEGNALGTAIAIERAEGHVFGLCLLNDWSARDLQRFEYQPLGPFLGKNFSTTISPWIVTLEALAPFRSTFVRDPQDPPLPAYLEVGNIASGAAIDMQLQVSLQTPRMHSAGEKPAALARSNFRHSYWSFAQMLAHHTVGGCNLQPGDLLGSGTQSGPAPEQAGSLLELTAGGARPIMLPNGETRTFLLDGDRVSLTAWCERAGFARIGFGEALGVVLPARAPP